MTKYRLIIGIRFDLNRDAKPDFEIKAADIAVPANVADAARMLIGFIDSTDTHPNNDQAEFPSKLRIPTIKIFGKQFTAEFVGEVFLQVVEVQ